MCATTTTHECSANLRNASQSFMCVDIFSKYIQVLCVSCRLGSKEVPRGRVGVSCCAFPWTYSGHDARTHLPKLWTEVQYKPVGNRLLHSVRISSRDTSLKLYSPPSRLPGWFWWVRAQVRTMVVLKRVQRFPCHCFGKHPLCNDTFPCMTSVGCLPQRNFLQ